MKSWFLKYLGFIAVTVLICFPVTAQEIKHIPVVEGVSWELASYRAKTISDINYEIELEIPASQKAPIEAVSDITFTLNNIDQDLQIDFKEKASNISRLRVNGKRRNVNHLNEHIVISRTDLKVGKNRVKIDYIAGNGALNRMPNFIYTLFVPDRMRTSFPSFDQPNLRATFELSLEVPFGWEAISAGEIRRPRPSNVPANTYRVRSPKTKKIQFKKSDKISTYLFSFVAGRFNKVEKEIDGLEMTMLHREPDEERVNRNSDDIFMHHKASIDYMEQYTGIKFPFKKFGFVLIPSFQFGGMEHVGAIQYRAETLMLDENPSPNERLARAALIGHETSHMWFGDLVTMDWFNDVWTKEVFANFMSAKLVNPSFPEIDHQLRSHLRLHPRAYSVDRTRGPNPIRQDLPNLKEAGVMYGDIIYNKAPIMMQQLELMIGENVFREGIREYLKTYSFSNATWPDLIEILDKRTDKDLKEWSDVWVNTPGRPVFEIISNTGTGTTLSQRDPMKLGRIWEQNFDIRKGEVPYNISFTTSAVNVDALGNNTDNAILINSNGMGYGLFPTDKNYIVESWDNLTDLERASALVNLYEHLLEGNGVITPREYIDLIIFAVEREENPLIINHLMRQLLPIYWSLFDQKGRIGIAPLIEEALWKEINNPKHDTGIRRIYFRNYANIALSKVAITRVKSVWDRTLVIDELKLAPRDFTNMAAFLAIKLPEEAGAIIEAQEPRINGADNQRRFKFIKPALSPDQSIRDKFFGELLLPENRYSETWVLSALNYLHHPLRHEHSKKYLHRSLEILQEIQITGDIFFPGRWLASTFKYYQSDYAVDTVREFLEERPDYNHQLRMKILQETDPLLRANRILKSLYNEETME